jgi:hypothetical protein
LKNLALLIISFYLVGCAPTLLSSNPRSVTIDADQLHGLEAQAMADAECGKHNKYAVEVSRPTHFNPRPYLFHCVD